MCLYAVDAIVNGAQTLTLSSLRMKMTANRSSHHPKQDPFRNRRLSVLAIHPDLLARASRPHDRANPVAMFRQVPRKLALRFAMLISDDSCSFRGSH